METANDIVIVTTPELDPPGPAIIYVNPAFTHLTGYSAEEVIGLTPRILQRPATNRATLDAIRAGLQAGAAVHEKVLNFAKDNTPYWLDLRIVALRDGDGNITHFAAIQRNVTLEKRRLDELELLAVRDALTGILNRHALMQAVETEIVLAQLEQAASGPCIAFIDIDNFKMVNDMFGHAAGDDVLCGVTDRLETNLRRSDLFGRLGGEEFAVCMPSVTLGEALPLAERLRGAVAATPFETAAGPIPVTISIGVAAFKDGDSPEGLIERADRAMYLAKRGGKNRVMA
ncbi:MAG TPA: diguanylate cyclase [Acidocella sp.]|nr:diguanylate cyclase [Acidocella sp.]